MPYTVAPGAILSVTFQGYLFGQQVMNTFHYALAGEASEDGGTALVEVRTAINVAVTGLYPTWRNCVCESVELVAQYYQWITPTRYVATEFLPAAREGNRAGPAVAPNIGCVITRQSLLAGRSGVSNIHIPGLAADDADGGFVINALKINLDELAIKSVEEIVLASGSKMQAVAFHRANPALSRVLITGYGQDTIRDQRRRTVGLGA